MTYSHTQGLHILTSYLPESPAGQTSLVGSGMGLKAAGQVMLLMLCHVMHSLLSLTGCPAGSPDPPSPDAELLMLQSQAMGAAIALTHLVTPPMGFSHQALEPWGSVPEPLVWAQSREGQCPTTSIGPSISPTPREDSLHKHPSSVQPAVHFRERDGASEGRK